MKVSQGNLSLKLLSKIWYNLDTSRGGEIGIREGLKSPCSQGRVGSSPALGTSPHTSFYFIAEIPSNT